MKLEVKKVDEDVETELYDAGNPEIPGERDHHTETFEITLTIESDHDSLSTLNQELTDADSLGLKEMISEQAHFNVWEASDIQETSLVAHENKIIQTVKATW